MERAGVEPESFIVGVEVGFAGDSSIFVVGSFEACS